MGDKHRGLWEISLQIRKKHTGRCDGYWEWYRKPASPAGGNNMKMRSGYFAKGKQVGKWTTYDKMGEVHKVTKFNKK